MAAYNLGCFSWSLQGQSDREQNEAMGVLKNWEELVLRKWALGVKIVFDL